MSDDKFKELAEDVVSETLLDAIYAPLLENQRGIVVDNIATALCNAVEPLEAEITKLKNAMNPDDGERYELIRSLAEKAEYCRENHDWHQWNNALIQKQDKIAELRKALEDILAEDARECFASNPPLFFVHKIAREALNV